MNTPKPSLIGCHAWDAMAMISAARTLVGSSDELQSEFDIVASSDGDIAFDSFLQLQAKIVSTLAYSGYLRGCASPEDLLEELDIVTSACPWNTVAQVHAINTRIGDMYEQLETEIDEPLPALSTLEIRIKIMNIFSMEAAS